MTHWNSNMDEARKEVMRKLFAEMTSNDCDIVEAIERVIQREIAKLRAQPPKQGEAE